MNKKSMDKSDFNIREEDDNIVITLSPALYPKNVVLRAAYRLLENYVVWVGGDGIESVVVKIKPQGEGKKISKDVIDLFFAELLQANMEETQAKRYADMRRILMELAMRHASKDARIVEMVENVVEGEDSQP